MYVEERRYRPSGFRETTPWQNAIILEGNKIFTLSGLKPGVMYRLRWQAPNKQYPDIKVSTRGKKDILATMKRLDAIMDVIYFRV